MSVTKLSVPLIIFSLFFYPIQVFSLQETAILSASSVALDDELHNAETVLLRYAEKNNSIREADNGVSLHLYNDGYVTVYYPAYMRRAGKYGMILDQSDMAHLWVLMSNENILAFNKESVRQRLYAEDQTQRDSLPELSTIADAAITLIDIYPNRYKSVGFGDGSQEAMKKISWYGLRWDASKYPELPEIRDLIALQQALQAIMQHPDLQKIE